MGLRLNLQGIFEAILGSENVYFQPPANVQIQYPCIVYKRDDIDVKFADNSPYHLTVRYLVTLIDRNPDTSFLSAVASLPMCIFDRNYAADNLNHDVFVLYF